MTFLSDPRVATVTLTRHGMWTHEVRADPGKQWPEGDTEVVFYDSRGGIIATIDGVVTTDKVSFSAAPDVTDEIPAGAGFEIFLTTDGGPYKIRYGRVIRREVGFPLAPGTSLSPTEALQFTDNFQRTALGSRWIPVLGRTSIHDNGSSPNGVGVDFEALYSQSAIRYYAPLQGDNPRVSVNLLYPNTGKTAVLLSANQTLTSYLALLFNSGISGTAPHDRIEICIGNGSPVAMTTVDQFAVELADADNYTILYNNLSHVTMLYKDTTTTPLVEWEDTDGDVPHGQGYRYLGFSWQADLLSTGPQITNWVAQDDVSALGGGS